MLKVCSLALALSALSGGASAQVSDLARDVKACRLLAEGPGRLACYDAMNVPAETATPAQPAAATAPAADAVARFGQQSIKSPDAAPELTRIESRIVGTFNGWGPNTRLAFENGQVWRIADGSKAFYELQSPKVIVHRGMLSAFYLEIEGVSFKVRVARVR